MGRPVPKKLFYDVRKKLSRKNYMKLLQQERRKKKYVRNIVLNSDLLAQYKGITNTEGDAMPHGAYNSNVPQVKGSALVGDIVGGYSQANATLVPATDDFYIEFTYKRTTDVTYERLFSQYSGTSSGRFTISVATASVGVPAVFVHGSSGSVSLTGVFVAIGVASRLRFVRSGNVFEFWQDGVLVDSDTVTGISIQQIATTLLATSDGLSRCSSVIWDVDINGVKFPMINVGKSIEHAIGSDNYFTHTNYTGDAVQEFTDGTGTDYANEFGYGITASGDRVPYDHPDAIEQYKPAPILTAVNKPCLQADGSGYSYFTIPASKMVGGITIELDYWHDGAEAADLRIIGGTSGDACLRTFGATAVWNYYVSAGTGGHFSVYVGDLSQTEVNRLKFVLANDDGVTSAQAYLNGVEKLNKNIAQTGLAFDDLFLWKYSANIQPSGKIANTRVWDAEGNLLAYSPMINVGEDREYSGGMAPYDLVHTGYTGEAFGTRDEGELIMAQRAFDIDLLSDTELWSDDDVDTSINWTLDTETGFWTHTAGATSSVVIRDKLILGNYYKCTITVAGVTAGYVRLRVGTGSTPTERSTNGTFTEIVQAVSSDDILLTPHSTFDGSVNVVEVKEYHPGITIADEYGNNIYDNRAEYQPNTKAHLDKLPCDHNFPLGTEFRQVIDDTGVVEPVHIEDLPLNTNDQVFNGKLLLIYDQSQDSETVDLIEDQIGE